MADRGSPQALIRHAAESGDWRLVELAVRTLEGRRAASPARRAFDALALTLRLAPGSTDTRRG